MTEPADFLALLDASILEVEQRAERLVAACRKLRESHEETRALLGGAVVVRAGSPVPQAVLDAAPGAITISPQLSAEEEAVRSEQLRYLRSRRAEKDALLAQNRSEQ